jgi:hypothetical protein
MNRIVCLSLAALATGSLAYAPMSASEARDAGGTVEILVDGAPVKRYPHAGRWYIEAIKGREYAIRLHNPYGVRVGVALSVDGLNTIDARESTSADARKWVLDPYQTIVISGWQTSQAEARRFEFTTEQASYGQALGKTANLGIVSAVFYRERVDTRLNEDNRQRHQGSPSPAKPAEPQASAVGGDEKRETEYAATGMGRRTDHPVTRVWLDLEETPALAMNIRYEFRPQLVRLGILQERRATDPLQRREHARGFEAGFCPAPPRQK